MALPFDARDGPTRPATGQQQGRSATAELRQVWFWASGGVAPGSVRNVLKGEGAGGTAEVRGPGAGVMQALQLDDARAQTHELAQQRPVLLLYLTLEIQRKELIMTSTKSI